MEELKKRILKEAEVGERVDKVLTVEASGIAVACFTALALGVPAVYAKKFQTGYIDPDVYAAEVHSFSMEKSYTIRVSRRYLEPDDRVLLVDDILASGQAILGLLEIVSRAGAEAVGVGVAIEKATKDGGEVLRRMGLRVESLVKVERIEDGRIILGED